MRTEAELTCPISHLVMASVFRLTRYSKAINCWSNLLLIEGDYAANVQPQIPVSVQQPGVNASHWSTLVMNMTSCCSPLMILAVAIGVGAAHSSSAAAAPEDTRPNIEVSGNILLINDYIWRGQSQTWGKPALQLGIEANHASGFYGGFWTSNVSDQWMPGGHIETDFYAGVRNKLPGAWSGIGYDLNLLYAYYPGANFDKAGFRPRLKSTLPNGLEASAALNYKALSVKAGRMLTSFYGWNTNNSPIGAFAGDPAAGVTGDTRGSWFIEANANYELAPGWNINGQIGREFIRNSQNLDWSYYKAGVTRTLGNWAASLAYSASSELAAMDDFVGLTNNGDTYDAMRPRVLFSISHSF